MKNTRDTVNPLSVLIYAGMFFVILRVGYLIYKEAHEAGAKTVTEETDESGTDTSVENQTKGEN